MSYEMQMVELARCAIGNHGELREVVFRSGNKDYDLIFADGTVLTPSDEESLKREYGSCAGYYEIAGQLGGTHPYSLLAFGYQGTGPGCFTTFLKEAGFSVSEQDLIGISPPQRLRPDGSSASAGEVAEEPEAAEEPVVEVAEEPVTPQAATEEPAEAAAAVPAVAAADWFEDPLRRHQYRYWDGAAWTDDVADNGVAAKDPLNPPPVPVPVQQSAPVAPKQKGPIEFDENGRMVAMHLPSTGGSWHLETQGQYTYMTKQTGTLVEAVECLREAAQVPPLTYFLVETPDGNLGRDMNGFYTEAPIKTSGLRLMTTEPIPAPVELESLTVFGDPMTNQSTIAAMKHAGQYARFILEMECGRCGYKSPVETVGGALERQCYCCGATNTGFRGMVNVVTPNGMVEI